MTDRESELTQLAKGDDIIVAVESGVALCKEFLFVRGEFEQAEYLLFGLAGIQSTALGYIIELTLGEAYIGMDERTRAQRFLEIAQDSRVDSVRIEATRLLETLTG
jgi:hypothetical protein